MQYKILFGLKGKNFPSEISFDIKVQHTRESEDYGYYEEET